MIAAFTRWWRSKDSHVSDRWLRAYAQSQSRIEFHSVSWNWEWMKRRHKLSIVRRQVGQRRTA